MKPKEIQELIDFIAQSGLDEVNIETEGFKLSVKKNSVQVRAVEPMQFQPQVMASAPVSQQQIATPSKAEPVADETAGYLTIKSPMIGTFYRSASPESPAFINVGDTIQKGQPVCIIEAMKLFNEIESEHAGKIVKVLVENATPVEYDQPLFLIDPS